MVCGDVPSPGWWETEGYNPIDAEGTEQTRGWDEIPSEEVAAKGILQPWWRGNAIIASSQEEADAIAERICNSVGGVSWHASYVDDDVDEEDED
jgi:hypothetical protein